MGSILQKDQLARWIALLIGLELVAHLPLAQCKEKRPSVLDCLTRSFKSHSLIYPRELVLYLSPQASFDDLKKIIKAHQGQIRYWDAINYKVAITLSDPRQIEALRAAQSVDAVTSRYQLHLSPEDLQKHSLKELVGFLKKGGARVVKAPTAANPNLVFLTDPVFLPSIRRELPTTAEIEGVPFLTKDPSHLGSEKPYLLRWKTAQHRWPTATSKIDQAVKDRFKSIVLQFASLDAGTYHLLVSRATDLADVEVHILAPRVGQYRVDIRCSPELAKKLVQSVSSDGVYDLIDLSIPSLAAPN